MAGALGTGFFLFRYFPDARGSGIPQAKAALFLRDGYISMRTVLGKFGLCSVSLASGIALGREGPSVQVGAGIASVLGRRLGLSPASVKALVPVGASAALAAAFNTPIAAVLFSLEEVMGDMHAPVLGSIVLSSATSWMVLHLVLGDEPLFHVPPYQLVHPIEFLVYAVLGLAGGLMSVAFVKLLLWQRKHFLRMRVSSRWMQPAVGGLTVGLLGWFFPDVLGVGYGIVSQALNGQIVIGTMALLVVLKMVATATCYSSGNAGGIFGPSLFMGAMLGGAVGGVAHMLLPDYTGSVGAYALVGMGAAFAGVVRVPLTSVIMIFEITRDYSIIVPLMIANLVSYFVSSRLQEEPIYEALQHQDGIHLPTGAGAREQLLMVGNALRPETQPLTAKQTVAQALATVEHARGAWPVTDSGGLCGMVTLAQLESAPPERELGELVPAPGANQNLTESNFPHVHPDQSLHTALQRIARSRLPALPVVSRTNIREVKGTIAVADVLAAYDVARTEKAEPTSEHSLPSRRLVVGGLSVLIGFGVIAGFLTTYSRAARAARAERAYSAGNEFSAAARIDEAIASYRAALSASHSLRDRLALGLALERAKRPAEARIYLEEVLRQQPADGAAHAALARLDAAAGRTDDAVAHYQRAVYGSWSDHPEEHRLAARLEMIDVLVKAKRRDQAGAELASLAASNSSDAALKKRIAREFAQLGMTNRAADLWHDVLHGDPQDREALEGLGEAQWALDDFAGCRRSFQAAGQDGPREALCAQAADMDPQQRGLRSAERRRRERALAAAVAAACNAPAPDVEAAEELWRARVGCEPPETALSHVMAKRTAQ